MGRKMSVDVTETGIRCGSLDLLGLLKTLPHFYFQTFPSRDFLLNVVCKT